MVIPIQFVNVGFFEYNDIRAMENSTRALFHRQEVNFLVIILHQYWSSFPFTVKF